MRRHPTEHAIITALKAHKGSYISGEELARESSVSRAAVWKHVSALRKKGYEIEAIPRRGYRLVTAPDLLLPEEIASLLTTDYIGGNIIHRERVGSTNALAKELAEQGAQEGTVVIAEEQIHGKGRLDRGWSSPRGGIWLSVILRPKLLPLEAPRFTLLAAVVVARAIETLGISPTIKWPNDVLIDGKKVCGILLELSAQADRIEHLVIGFGINANNDLGALPAEAQGRATTIAAVLGHAIDRARLVAALLRALEEQYKRLVAGGWQQIRSEWLRRCDTVGERVALATLHGVVEGEFAGVDEYGAIQIRQADGAMRSFAAGDVTVLRKERF